LLLSTIAIRLYGASGAFVGNAVTNDLDSD